MKILNVLLMLVISVNSYSRTQTPEERLENLTIKISELTCGLACGTNSIPLTANCAIKGTCEQNNIGNQAIECARERVNDIYFSPENNSMICNAIGTLPNGTPIKHANVGGFCVATACMCCTTEEAQNQSPNTKELETTDNADTLR